MSFFEKLKDGLSKTRKNFTEKIETLVGLSTEVDEDFLEELEMVLIAGDVGVKTTEKIMKAVRDAARSREIKSPDDVLPFLKAYVANLLRDEGQRMHLSGSPSVILVVGVNGVGKTTTIGKLSNYYRLMGNKVMLAAGDTFRAAAAEQGAALGTTAGLGAGHRAQPQPVSLALATREHRAGAQHAGTRAPEDPGSGTVGGPGPVAIPRARNEHLDRLSAARVSHRRGWCLGASRCLFAGRDLV